jgi:hypothetical protein
MVNLQQLYCCIFVTVTVADMPQCLTSSVRELRIVYTILQSCVERREQRMVQCDTESQLHLLSHSFYGLQRKYLSL